MHHTDSPVLKEASCPDLLTAEQAVLLSPTMNDDISSVVNARFLFDLDLCAGIYEEDIMSTEPNPISLSKSIDPTVVKPV